MRGNARGEEKRSEGDVRGGEGRGVRRSEWEWRIREGCDRRGERVCVRGNVSVCLSVCECVCECAYTCECVRKKKSV